MTNDELKAAALKMAQTIIQTINEKLFDLQVSPALLFDAEKEAKLISEAIIYETQPLVDADRQKIERLEEKINDYEVALGLVAKKARKIVGVVNRTTQGKEPF